MQRCFGRNEVGDLKNQEKPIGADVSKGRESYEIRSQIM